MQNVVILKKIGLEGDFAVGIYLSEALNPPPFTLYAWFHNSVYLFTREVELRR
jgi:hypothetical protein